MAAVGSCVPGSLVAARVRGLCTVPVLEHRVGPQGYLNGSYSNRGIGAVRVRATHADRDDGNENESAKDWQVRL